MELKPGYKQTEVGVIPADWEVSELGSLLLSRPDYGINAPAVPLSGNLPAYLRITDISEDGRFKPDNLVSVNHSASGNYFLSPSELVFARTGASVGKSYLYDANDGPLVFAGFLIRVRPDTNRLCPAFLSACVTTSGYWNWVRQTSMRSGQPGINGNEYAKLRLPLPPLSEQRAIATALSEVDGLIRAQEQLIAKKRDLKQAAMQQLLTAQHRLPGWTSEWTTKRLGDIAKLYQPETIGQSVFTEDGFPVYGANGIIGRYNRFNHSTPQITISCRGNCGTVNRTEDKSWITGNAMVVNLDHNKSVDKNFMFHMLNSQDFSILVTGSGQPQIVRGPLSEFAVKMPLDRAEQTAIAEVLSEQDEELAKLEARRAKTRALKQGMMQSLLTGRIRLI